MVDRLRPRRAACAVLAVLGSLVAGCHATRADAPSHASADALDVRIAPGDFDRDPSVVGPEDALADLAVAVRIFDAAYAGVDGRPRTPSSELLEEARAQILAHATVPPRPFASLVRQLFWQPDGHLSFGWGGVSPVRLLAKPWTDSAVSAPVFDRVDDAGAWLEGARLVGCDLAAPERAVLPTADGRYVLGVFDPRAEDHVACTVEDAAGASSELTLPLRKVSPGRGRRGARAVELSRGDVPVLAIRTFDNVAEAELVELPRIARELRERSAFVVDLRGNTGGNYAFAEPFLLELTNATLRRLDEREVVSVEAAEGRANLVRARLAQGDVPASAKPHFLAQLAALEQAARSLRARGAERTDLEVRGETVHGRAPRPLEGRAVFLVDGRCASACEMMLALARQIPGVLVAGQNTRGGMAAGELALFRLPRSGLLLSLGTRAFSDPLGDFSEARGFLPDVWIDDATGDSIATAKRLAAGSFEPVVRNRRAPRASATARVDPR